MKKSLVISLALVAGLALVTACTKSISKGSTGKPIASASVNNLTATLSSAAGQLQQGDQE